MLAVLFQQIKVNIYLLLKKGRNKNSYYPPQKTKRIFFNNYSIYYNYVLYYNYSLFSDQIKETIIYRLPLNILLEIISSANVDECMKFHKVDLTAVEVESTIGINISHGRYVTR